MGTRGSITFVANGVEKTVYNHFDSYPEGVGVQVLGEIRSRVDKGTAEGLKAQIANLTKVDEHTVITPAHVEALKDYTDLHVGNGTGEPDLWYKLLRNTQGDVAAILKCGFYESAEDFPSDSLFCEWGYVIDTDAEKFEVYRGFQREPHDEGRFAGRVVMETHRTDQFYPIRLVGSFDFDDLPTDEEFEGLSRSFRVRGVGSIAGALRDALPRIDDELHPFVDHLIAHLTCEVDMDSDDVIAHTQDVLDSYDEGEGAEEVDMAVPSHQLDEYAESALSEFGFEGCGQTMWGIRDMAQYVYNRTKMSEAKRAIEEVLEEL